jgi:hypothetical protein
MNYVLVELAPSCLSVCPSAWNNSAPTGGWGEGGDFHEISHLKISRIFVEKIKVSSKSDKNSA